MVQLNTRMKSTETEKTGRSSVGRENLELVLSTAKRRGSVSLLEADEDQGIVRKKQLNIEQKNIEGKSFNIQKYGICQLIVDANQAKRLYETTT